MTSNKEPLGQTPIVFIDLVEDVSTNRSTYISNRSSKTTEQNNNRGAVTHYRRRVHRQQQGLARTTATGQQQEELLDFRASSVSGRRKKILRETTTEIINLDDTILLNDDDNQNTQCYVNDSVSKRALLLICPICLEELSDKLKPTSTRCGHIFCAECLKKVASDRKKCPTCQAPIRLKTCTRLYF